MKKSRPNRQGPLWLMIGPGEQLAKAPGVITSLCGTTSVPNHAKVRAGDL